MQKAEASGFEARNKEFKYEEICIVGSGIDWVCGVLTK